MAPELQTLFVVFSLALFFSFMAVRYFLQRAKRDGSDRLRALRNGLLLALILFAGSILIYDAIKPAPELKQGDADWCDKNPQECASPPPVFSIR